MRKYTELEDLMCLGCHPYESLFVDTTHKVINICYSFALRFWNVTTHEELNGKTKRFDNCGFKASQSLRDYFKDPTLTFIIPSQRINSFEHFVQVINIPFYEGYTIKLIEEEKSQKLCFAHSSFNQRTYYSVILLLLCLSMALL